MSVRDYFEAEERMCHPCIKSKLNGCVIMVSSATIATEPLSRRQAIRYESQGQTLDHRAMLRSSCARMMAGCNYIRKYPHEIYSFSRTSFALRAEAQDVCKMLGTPYRPFEDSLPLPRAFASYEESVVGAIGEDTFEDEYIEETIDIFGQDNKFDSEFYNEDLDLFDVYDGDAHAYECLTEYTEGSGVKSAMRTEAVKDDCDPTVLIKAATVLDTVLYPKDGSKTDADCFVLESQAFPHVYGDVFSAKYGSDTNEAHGKCQWNIDIIDSDSDSDVSEEDDDTPSDDDMSSAGDMVAKGDVHDIADDVRDMSRKIISGHAGLYEVHRKMGSVTKLRA
ncbi:hypothetical protein SARC_10104 [Sphaeroforma arctica JP610]|uniref:Uncharacterized protein n=1 Tax=Sphaeroforma arctica JP610 TaxID=667725 RepID=A0A0L0FLS6_9EUKA|nr:hypothetical protein SARC_10104 [Sphaeroforma arctica JP610]KNC77436.1 hypothetical protein SARC_10104 [Sphaeroforma arctica JP610]|eukprot:XP_014151338.1 hypothetical protein SARC_10104 [Sphaeroforma arctica JP610]